VITDDEVFRLLERADPARAEDAVPVVDATGYLDARRARAATMTLSETEPPPIESTRRRWTIIATVAAGVAATVAMIAVVISRDVATAPTDAPTPTVIVENTQNSPAATTTVPATPIPVATAAPDVSGEVGLARVLEDPLPEEVDLASDETVYRPGYGPTEVTRARTHVSLRTCNWVSEPCSGPRNWSYVAGSADDPDAHTGLLGSADDLALSAVDDRLFVASELLAPNSQEVPVAWLIDSVTGQRSVLTWQDDPTTLDSPNKTLVLFPVNSQPYFRTPPRGFLPRVVDNSEGTIRLLNVPGHASTAVQIHQAQSGSGRIWIGTARDDGYAGLAYTDDGGTSWTDVELPEQLRPTSEELSQGPYYEGLTVAATGDHVAVAVALCASVCPDNRLFTSADAGTTWVGDEPPPDSGNFRELFVLGDRLVYAMSFDSYLAVLLVSGPTSDWSALHIVEGVADRSGRADFGIGQSGIASLYGFSQGDPLTFSTDLTDWWRIDNLTAKPEF